MAVGRRDTGDDAIGGFRTEARTLMRQFFLGGKWEDYLDAADLYEQLPRPILEDYGPHSPSLIPDVKHSVRRWIRWYHWLAAEGYALRPCFEPGWVEDKTVDPRLREDPFFHYRESGIDATRTEDRVQVWLKPLRPLASRQNLDVVAYLSSKPLRDDPRNHCCPLLDLLYAPAVDGEEYCIMVLPFLRDPWLLPAPETVGDLLHRAGQLAEGVAFMHANNVVHRNICDKHVMLDASRLIPTGWLNDAPDWYKDEDGISRRTVVRRFSDVPVRYYFTGLLGALCLERGPKLSGTSTVRQPAPERPPVGSPGPSKYDLFAHDVFHFGNMVYHWMHKYRHLDVLQPLIERLARACPADPPSVPAVLAQLDKIIARCGPATARAPLMYRKLDSTLKFVAVWGWNIAQHCLRAAKTVPGPDTLARPT